MGNKSGIGHGPEVVGDVTSLSGNVIYADGKGDILFVGKDVERMFPGIGIGQHESHGCLYDRFSDKLLTRAMRNEPFKMLMRTETIPTVYFWYVYIPVLGGNGKTLASVSFLEECRADGMGLRAAVDSASIAADQSDRLKQAFLANLSHGLRTPLNAIVGFADLISTSDDDGEKRVYAKIISDNTDAFLHEMDDMLYLAKVETGQLEFKMSRFDMNEVCHDVASSIESRCAGKRLKLVVDTHEQPCMVTSDRIAVTKVWLDLADNAVSFTDTGSITMGCSPAGIDNARFFCRDTGSGINDAQRPFVFDKFTKFGHYDSGAGIGLSLCKALSDKLGWQLGFQSQVGKGSEFWVQLQA